MNLERLAELLRERNRVSTKIAALIGRPALNSHVGEYIASQVFDIELYDKENLAKYLDLIIFKIPSLR